MSQPSFTLAAPVPPAPSRGHAACAWLLASRWRIFAIGMLALALVALVDWQTGPHVMLTSFYLLPACILVWFFGRRVGYLVALVNGGIWVALDIGGSISGPLLYWNAVMRVLTLIVMVHIIAACREFADQVDRLVELRTADLARQLRERQAAEQAIRTLATQVSAAEDLERRRLGQDLHDTVGQGLSVLKLQLDCYLAEHSEMREAAAPWSASLENVIHQARTLNLQLYPSMLDELGLGATLRWYASQLEAQTAASIVISEGGAPRKLDAPMAGFLFRTIRELFTNSLKHGRAGQVCAQLRWRGDGLRIIVDDDGAGFDSKSLSSPMPGRGLGLTWIQERTRSLGGELVVESSVGGGARVLLDMPLQAEVEVQP